MYNRITLIVIVGTREDAMSEMWSRRVRIHQGSRVQVYLAHAPMLQCCLLPRSVKAKRDSDDPFLCVHEVQRELP